MAKQTKCDSCGENVIWYYNSTLCKQCIIDFFEKKETNNANNKK